MEAADQTAAKSAEQPAEEETAVHKVTSVLWSGVSSFNVETELLLATLWVLLLGSAPLAIYWWGEKSVTKSAITLSGLMWIALFGGLYLFTQVILFNSSHFDRVRSLTIIECTYFMTQVITTVGYGDITPAMPRGQVFVGIYVTLSFFVIALLVTEMQSVVMGKVANYKEKLATKFEGLEETTSLGKIAESISNSSMVRSFSTAQATQPSQQFMLKPGKPSAKPLIAPVSTFLGIAATWAIFFHTFPGEGKTLLEAIYMSLITLTTVGFGAVTPNTEAGMIFGSFFMFFGTASLVSVVSHFSTFVLQMGQWEAWTPNQFAENLSKLKEHVKSSSKNNEISQLDFLCFTIVQKDLARQEDIDAIKEAYWAMLGADGKVSLKSIASYHGEDVDPSGELCANDTETGASQSASRRGSPRGASSDGK